MRFPGHETVSIGNHVRVTAFVPISKKLDEFSVEQDVEKFLRRVQLKAFFHDKEDDSNTSEKDIFETLQTRKSKIENRKSQRASSPL